ncbi:17401_t:CDS:2, partial [Cetraspora pellucida]
VVREGGVGEGVEGGECLTERMGEVWEVKVGDDLREVDFAKERERLRTKYLQENK